MSAEPRYLGKYQLLERLAHGGMGEVWKARDTQLQRYVAIKLLLSNWQNDPDFVNRFEREAQLVASLHHPNIVKIHNFHVSLPPESETTRIYMVMDYVQGQTLADFVRNTSRKGQWANAADIVYIFALTGLALDYAHQRSVIHRDIKPANILLDQRLQFARPFGEPVLTDFGIARLQGISAGTVIGSVIGTPLYIAPEQAMGRYDDKRSDLYSLGIILYEMMTGVTPFRGDNSITIIMQHINEIPTPPTLINPQITPALAEVILKSIAKQPEDRFSSASAMTVAIAEAFNVPVPELLVEAMRGPSQSFSPSHTRPSASDYTPTLPSPAAHAQPMPASIPPASASNPYIAQPPVASMYDSPAIPVKDSDNMSPLLFDAGYSRPVASTQQSDTNLRTTPVQSVPLPVAPPAPAPDALPVKWPGANRRLYVALIALLVVVLLAAGLGYFLTSSGNNANTVVGQIHFSSTVSPGSYNALQIDLHNIPAPAQGFQYYAWLESPSSEIEVPHWMLQVNQGSIHATNLTYPGYKNLLLSNALFLITRESVNSPAPVVPATDLSARLYYVRITQTSLTDFALRPCPSGASSTACIG